MSTDTSTAWMKQEAEPAPAPEVVEEAIAETVEPVPARYDDEGEWDLWPIGDRILCLEIPLSERLDSGLFRPAHTKDRPYEARVLAVGKGSKSVTGARLQMDVAEGDYVLYSQHAGVRANVKGTEYLFLREDEILASKRRRVDALHETPVSE